MTGTTLGLTILLLLQKDCCISARNSTNCFRKQNDSEKTSHSDVIAADIHHMDAVCRHLTYAGANIYFMCNVIDVHTK